MIYPKSRKHYIDLLARNWLSDLDSKEIIRNACLFAGIYFCCPKWQKDLIMPQDAKQKEVKNIIFNSLESKKEAIEIEIEHIRKWLHSDSLGYHTFNMLNADEYTLSNTI